jgi:CheY-like chemotaxis protein
MSNAGHMDIEIEKVDVSAGLAEQIPNLTSGQFVQLTVRDSGCGMDDVTLARIFEPFYSTKDLREGTGLGLSVVYGIVKEHGGGILVKSVLNKGTEFRIYFPAVARTAPHTSASSEPMPTVTRAAGEKLLFVDDDEDLVFISQNLLEKMGYRVQVCGSGEEALALFAGDAQAFDAVITDMTMPGMSGLDLAEKVLAIRPNLPIIVMSGHVRDADSERALALGLGSIHWKPNTVEDLAETLRERLLRAKV